jgi:hypothetical protein
MNPSGGAREGAGRPTMYDERMARLFVTLPVWMIEWLKSQPGGASAWIREQVKREHLARAQAERDVEGSGVLRNGEG